MRGLRKFYLSVAAFSVLAGSLAAFAFAFNLPKWFPFSSERSLNEWEAKIFKGKVIYKVERKGREDFLHALSIRSASAIFYKIKDRYRAEDYPMISWKWMVCSFPDKEKLKARQGIEKDDYAARVYVIFPSLNFMASRVLEYVWDESVPPETVCASPYSKNIKLIVVRTGQPPEKNVFLSQERNILQDYRRAFGGDPKLKIGAIALMSDADNTAGIAEAYFDDIKIGYK